jgi:predicted nucleic acid-binding Zn ribbon protein
MSDRRKVVPIAYCECCGARPRQPFPLLGVYTPGSGWYCIPCERTIMRAGQANGTPASEAFVRRLAARSEVSR